MLVKDWFSEKMDEGSSLVLKYFLLLEKHSLENLNFLK